MMDALDDLLQRERCYGPFRQQDLEQPNEGPWQHWRLRRDDRDVAWLLFDQQGQSANLLGGAALRELGDVLASLRREMPRALVLRSAKPASFCLGADLHDFAAVDNEADAVRQLVDAHLLAQQLIDLPCPTLAVVHGDTLGGGLELALCCDMRLAAPDARLGLPEILVGLHPGLGATARLPDLVDPLLAMRMMLSGKPLKADAAVQAGLLDSVAPEHALPALIDNAVNGRLTLQRRNLRARPYRLDWVRRLAAMGLQRRADALVDPAHYHAPSALIDLWRRHGGKPDLMLHREIYSFARLLASSTTGNLIQLFFLRQRLKAQGAADPRRRASHVHLLGDSQVGVELAALAALRGLRVSIGDQQAMSRCIRHLAGTTDLQAALDQLIFDSDHHGVAQADALIDAQTGDLETRRATLARLEPRMRPQALLLSLHDALEPLRSALGDAGRLLGVRFAGPVQRGTLAELASHSTGRTISQQHARQLLGQLACLPVPVSSQPGLLLRRVLAPMLLEALLLLEEGHEASAIDQAALDFGFSKGPLALLDDWGLADSLHLFNQLHAERDTPLAEPPALLRNWVEQGRERIRPRQPRRWALPGRKPARLPAEEGDRMLLVLLNSAVRACRQGIVADDELLDATLTLSGHFPAFRGGPLRYARSCGHAALITRLQDLSESQGPRFTPDPGWTPVEESEAGQG